DKNDPNLLQFRNAARFVTRGVEAEASYRTTDGWYGFGGVTYANVGAAEPMSALGFGSVPNAPPLVAASGVSTPKLYELAHVSAELQYVGERPTRPDTDTSMPLPPAPAWLGINATVYVPDVSGFDVTAGVRNMVGKPIQVVAPGDYDRYDETTMTTKTIPLI